jgi:hypothetical protein
MRLRTRVAAIGLVTGLLVAGGTVVAAPALALGSAWNWCSLNNDFYGTSASTGAQTYQTTSGRCGYVRVREAYVPYSGAPTTYTSYTKNILKIVQGSPGYPVIGGTHQVTAPDSGFPSSFTT